VADDEIPLVGGRSTAGVVRKGNTVRRPAGPWSPVVQAYLRHLRAAGFTGAPEPLGFDDQGREVLEFVEGETLATPQDPHRAVALTEWPAPWRSEESLDAAGALVRALHDASAGFEPVDPVWRMHERPMRSSEIVCHADYGVWNTVYRDGLPVA